MEHLGHLFRFKRYSVDRNRTSVFLVRRENDDRTREFFLSNSERYLAVWERGPVSSKDDSGIRYMESTIEVICAVYDLETGTVKPIPREIILKDINDVNIHFSPDEKSAMLQVKNKHDRVAVTWWNLETGVIIRTVLSYFYQNEAMWSLTNDYLFEYGFEMLTYHYPNTERKEQSSYEYQILCNGNFINVEYGRITVIPIDGGAKTHFENPVFSSSYDLDVTSIFRDHVIKFDDIDDRRVDIINVTDKTVSTIYFDKEHLSSVEQTLVIVFQKKTLRKIIKLLLSTLPEDSLYGMLPDTLQYYVEELIVE